MFIEPEFVVKRKDSLGMAAKEHTEQMMSTLRTEWDDSEVSQSRESKEAMNVYSSVSKPKPANSGQTMDDANADEVIMDSDHLA